MFSNATPMFFSHALSRGDYHFAEQVWLNAMTYILKREVDHTNTPAKNKYFSAYSDENCNMKQKGNYNLMFVLGERHHCKPKQQPILGIWLLLLVVSSP